MGYYQHDLALIHDRGFGAHGDRCAPAIVDLLAPVRGGLVLELGCGSGALTRRLMAAGSRVVATDASPDMLSLAREALGPDADVRQLTLPDDPLPAADAIVSVGHAISYLPDGTAPDKFVREITTFVPDGAGAWRRGQERHENVLVDTSRIPALLGERGVSAAVGTAFGDVELPPGLVAVTGVKS